MNVLHPNTFLWLYASVCVTACMYTCSMYGCLFVCVVTVHGRGAMVQQQGDTLLMTPGAGQAKGGPTLWAANVHFQQGRQENL